MLIPDYRKGELPKQLMLNKETFLKFSNNNRDSEIKFRSGFFELLSVIGINKE